jgi:hypothetical protein
LYVGQSGSYGGGIEYNGDNSPASTGAGADYITLYRVSDGTYNWTARNFHNNNDWEFRGEVFCNGGWFRTFGDRGWYNQTHGGGWYMTDSTWMRTYNQKSIWAGSGNICCSGNMGAGTSSPGHKLDVRGTARAETFITDYEYKTQDAGVVKHGGILAMDQFTWRRVVPQRWSGYIVWTPVANDHSAFAIRVVNNSNAGAGSRDWRVQTDYYSSAR